MKRRSFNKTLYNNVYSRYKPPENSASLPPTPQWALRAVGIYRFVFTTNVAAGAALLLCLSLLLQPVSQVYAEESDQEAPVSVIEDGQIASEIETIETTEPANVEPTDDPDVLDIGDDEADSGVADTPGDARDSDVTDTRTLVGQTDQEVTEDTATSTSSKSVLGESVGSDNDTELESSSTSTASSTGAITDEDSDLTTHGTSGSQSSSTNNDTTQASSSNSSSEAVTTTGIGPESSNTSTEEPTATTSASNETKSASSTNVVPETVVVSNVQTDNVYAFNRNECTEVQDGSFYCQKISYDRVAANDLFAAPDAGGDMEIYVTQNGQQMKITDNTVDDASPYYDARSKTLVWHRLINDRYQIMSYDVTTGEETQLTDTNVNNMEPTRNGEYTVWQRWVDTNWEIILYIDGEERQLTSSAEHDIAPNIRGNLIIWNVRASDGSESLMTYDIAGDLYNQISDTDGVSVSNPRMLVMYEAQYQNGDTVMKGFDVVTGEIIPIESIPGELPTDIPSPETTGEVRALPTNPQAEEELVQEPELDDPEDDTIHTTAPGDLDLTSTTTVAASSPLLHETYDLDLRPTGPLDAATTTDDVLIDQAAIPDIVIPAFAPDIQVGEASVQATSTQQTS